jgi:ribosomal protein S17
MRIEIAIDTPELKVIQALKGSEILWFCIGLIRTRRKERGIEAAAGQTGGAAKFDSADDRYLEWKIFYDREAISKFVSDEQMSDMIGTVTSVATEKNIVAKTTNPVTSQTIEKALSRIKKNYVVWGPEEMASFLDDIQTNAAKVRG